MSLTNPTNSINSTNPTNPTNSINSTNPTNSTNPPPPVPILDLTRQYETIRDEIDSAVLGVIRSGRYVLGPYVKEFEERAAEYVGVKHAIGVASGTDALLLSLKALGIGPGDAVIVPSFTFFATAGVVHNLGATPIFADIDPRTFNIDPASVRNILESPYPNNPTNPTNPINPTNSTNPTNPIDSIRAIIPVHLYGQPADMDEVMAIAKEYDLFVIEDAAQAIGATYRTANPNKPNEPNQPNQPNEPNKPNKPNKLKSGTIGHLGCFSFYPTKNLGAYGDGGMVVTNDDALAERLLLLRVHGAKPKYYHRLVGTNSRLDAIQAAILSVKLKHLGNWSKARARLADRYDDALNGIEGIITPYRAPDRSHIFHQYTVRVLNGKRDALRDHLKNEGIGTMIYYPLPLHLQECFSHLGYREGDLPESERASREVLSLPIFPRAEERGDRPPPREYSGFLRLSSGELTGISLFDINITEGSPMTDRKDKLATREDLRQLGNSLTEKIESNAEKIADVEKSLTEKIEANAAKIEANAEKIEANAAKIEANAAKIEANAKKIDANAVRLDKLTVLVVSPGEPRQNRADGHPRRVQPPDGRGDGQLGPTDRVFLPLGRGEGGGGFSDRSD